MKKVVITSLILFLFSTNVFAYLQSFTTEEHLEQSELVVIGKLTSVSETFDLGRMGQGLIEIETVLTPHIKTNEGSFLKPKDKLQIKWNEFFSCVNGWHKKAENKRGIWLLKIEKDGTVSAFHPGKFMSLNELGKIKKLLDKSKMKEPSNFVTVQKNDSTEQALLRGFLTFLLAFFLYRFSYRSK